MQQPFEISVGTCKPRAITEFYAHKLNPVYAQGVTYNKLLSYKAGLRAYHFGQKSGFTLIHDLPGRKDRRKLDNLAWRGIDPNTMLPLP